MNVAICDDEIDFLDELQSKLREYAKEKNIYFNISRFESGNSFMNYYMTHKDFDIIFLDINMPGINGIELAQMLRDKGDKVSIVFLTSLIQYALDGYRVCALRYLIKPLTYHKLRRELNGILTEIRNRVDDFFVVKNDNGVYKIYIKDILYIETFERNTLIHLKDNKILSYKSLKYYEENLDKRFFRCHSGYLVNMSEISVVEKFDIHLANGDIIPLSKNRKRDFSQKMANYYGNLI